MNRFRKKKEPSLMEELKELELLEEGEMVDIPDLEVEYLIEENSMSVIVRCLNPYVHKVGGLVKALQPIWGLEDRVQGRVVGEDRVQFIFNSETDLQFVLTKGPWFVNGWMVAMEQWTPDPNVEFLQRIKFWIRVRGLPIHMLKKQVVESLLGPLGKVEKVELHAKNSNSLEYVRALVTINTKEPLQLWRTTRLKSGTTYPTELEYEKLLKVCYGCKRLTHDQTKCPYQIQVRECEESLRTDRRKKTSLKEKLLEKETKAKETLKNSVSKEAVLGTFKATGSARTRKGEGQDSYKEDKRKGKRVVSTPRVVWKQKADKGGTEKTRSTEESSANPRGSEEVSGIRSKSIEHGGVEKSLGTSETGSVFNRLGNVEEEWGSKGSRGRRSGREQSEDLRLKLSGTSSGEKNDGKSSKGSRSPPSVFERLGKQTSTSPRLNIREEEPKSQPSKRRRMTNSDERIPKKARKGSSGKKKESPSVFQRLGGLGRDSEVICQGEGNHYALMAAVTPIHSARVAAFSPVHSVRRIVLGSGSNLKEGLMGNSNPSRSI
ncbi:uncharacterized protein LOC106408719 [Brassica napus]|uniref:uncharacterized protein LOC106408719 n=1 Tax=Brassica napus TaxID=3708 RepID=UPI00207A6587|nr:uncharacterized protein LOC106408719 [Brassica napus]